MKARSSSLRLVEPRSLQESPQPGLRIVILDCPMDTWSDPRSRALFGEMIALRLRGYGSEYPYGSLPIDAADWVCTHVLVCEETAGPGGPLRPLVGYKMTTLDRCREFGLDFLAYGVLRSSGAHEHAAAVDGILARAERSGRRIGYVSSWTIDPDTRKDRVRTELLKELVHSTHVQLQREYGVEEMLICGVLRFKTDKFEEALGYRRIARVGGGEALPSFHQASLKGEEVVMLHLESFSELGEARAAQHAGLWQARETFCAEARRPGSPLKKAA